MVVPLLDILNSHSSKTFLPCTFFRWVYHLLLIIPTLRRATCNFAQRPISRCNALSLRRGTLTSWFTSHLLSSLGPSGCMNQRTQKKGLTPNHKHLKNSIDMQRRSFKSFFTQNHRRGTSLGVTHLLLPYLPWLEKGSWPCDRESTGKTHQKITLLLTYVDMPTGKNKALHHENGWELELLPKTEMI